MAKAADVYKKIVDTGKPKKAIKEIHSRPTADGKTIHEHHHHHPEHHPMEEHVTDGTPDAMAQHLAANPMTATPPAMPDAGAAPDGAPSGPSPTGPPSGM